MKLYFSPGACSLAPHIVLQATGLPCALERVDLRTKQTAGGIDFRTINPKGYVPALQLDDGQMLTEAQVIVQYLADLAPPSGLAPAAGTFERYQLMEWLSYLATELQKRFAPLFTPGTSSQAKEAAWAALATPLNHVASRLEGREYLCGESFTVADAYLFAALGWVGFAGFTLADWPVLQAWQGRIARLPFVHAAMKEEGLI